MSIATAYDVIRNSSASRDYPNHLFCDNVKQIEIEFARECIGKTLYNWIVSKKATLPASYAEYVTGCSYSVNDYVVRIGCLFKSLSNFNLSDPLEETGDWEPFNRFTDAYAKELWEQYCIKIIAETAYRDSLVPITFRSSAGGIIVGNAGHGGGEMRNADIKEINAVKVECNVKIARLTKNMNEWIEAKMLAKNIPQTEVCQGECQVKKRSGRRWHFAN